MAAAFGFDVAPELLEPAKPATAPPGRRPGPVDEEPDRVLAVAATLVAAPPPEKREAESAAEPAPATATSLPAKPVPARPRSIPGRRGAEETADRLEAALLNQLHALEETLRDRPAKMPPVMPLRSPDKAPRVARPDPAAPPGTLGRSPFAPDPVRQRSYVDLREAAPAPAPALADDAAPWRKYLAEPSVAAERRTTPRRTPASRPRPGPTPLAEAPGTGTEERRRGVRAMSAAAMLGLGVGLGLLVLLRPFAETAPLVTAAADAPPPASAQKEATPPAVGPALATLLSDGPSMRAKTPGTAVIAEAGTPPEALLADAAPVPAPVAPAPPVIRPPPGQPIQVARGSEPFGPEAPMAYGPTTPSYDPAQSVLNDAETAATAEAEPSVAARAVTSRGSRATISQFVNLRARPDNGAPVVAVLAQGLSVRVIGCDYWCEIEAGGKRGYVYKKFVGR